MNSSKAVTVSRVGLCAVTLALGLAASAQAAVSIVINNLDPAGVGFNDPTPAVPVGGNVGTTVGQQRQIAFAHAANVWGATLTSAVPIVINASFDALTCTASSAVLGSAGATQVFSDFPGAPLPSTWYSFALANKIAGTDLDPTSAQIRARFNRNLGTAGCLPASPWYYGLDGNEGAGIDFVAVLMHEMGHGLGFQTFTSGATGAPLAGRPSVWDHFLLDTVTGKTWVNSTDSERVSSAISVNNLVWNGPLVTAAVPTVLRVGVPSGCTLHAVPGPVSPPAHRHRDGRRAQGQPARPGAVCAGRRQRGGRRVHAEPLLRRAGAGVPRAPGRGQARHPRAGHQHRQRQRRHRRRRPGARAPDLRRRWRA
jgi:hypothetical protein